MKIPMIPDLTRVARSYAEFRAIAGVGAIRNEADHYAVPASSSRNVLRFLMNQHALANLTTKGTR